MFTDFRLMSKALLTDDSQGKQKWLTSYKSGNPIISEARHSYIKTSSLHCLHIHMKM